MRDLNLKTIDERLSKLEAFVTSLNSDTSEPSLEARIEKIESIFRPEPGMEYIMEEDAPETPDPTVPSTPAEGGEGAES